MISCGGSHPFILHTLKREYPAGVSNNTNILIFYYWSIGRVAVIDSNSKSSKFGLILLMASIGAEN
jgi:hypothetical protein